MKKNVSVIAVVAAMVMALMMSIASASMRTPEVPEYPMVTYSGMVQTSSGVDSSDFVLQK